MATILIVDDNLDAARPLARLLAHVGHTTSCIGSGEEAIARLGEQVPDLMLLDVMMPGMDGLEVLGQVVGDARTAALPVVFFSAVSDPQFREHALSKGATDYWVKASMDYDQINRRVKDLVAPPAGA